MNKHINIETFKDRVFLHLMLCVGLPEEEQLEMNQRFYDTQKKYIDPENELSNTEYQEKILKPTQEAGKLVMYEIRKYENITRRH